MPAKIIALVACLFSLPAAAVSNEYHTRPNCWEKPRIYSSADMRPEVTIEQASGSLTEAVLSSNGAYGFVLREVDGGGEEPRRAVLDISIERPYLLRLQLEDIRFTEPPRWINEKLLHVRVWWGRIAGSDYIVDVEREEIVLREGFVFGSIAWEQFQQCETPEWKGNHPGCDCFPGAPEGWRATPLGEASSPE